MYLQGGHMTQFIPYKSKNARTSPDRKPIFKEPLPILEILARMVDEGVITNCCATEAFKVNDPESFRAFCKKWNLLGD